MPVPVPEEREDPAGVWLSTDEAWDEKVVEAEAGMEV